MSEQAEIQVLLNDLHDAIDDLHYANYDHIARKAYDKYRKLSDYIHKMFRGKSKGIKLDLCSFEGGKIDEMKLPFNAGYHCAECFTRKQMQKGMVFDAFDYVVINFWESHDVFIRKDADYNITKKIVKKDV